MSWHRLWAEFCRVRRGISSGFVIDVELYCTVLYCDYSDYSDYIDYIDYGGYCDYSEYNDSSDYND